MAGQRYIKGGIDCLMRRRPRPDQPAPASPQDTHTPIEAGRLDLDQMNITHRNGQAPSRQVRHINESLARATWAGQSFCLVTSVALGLFVPEGQALAQAELQAQAPGCVVVEVAVEDREEFAQKKPSPVGKRVEAKKSQLAVQGGKTEPISGSSSSSTEDSSTREKAFAQGQNMADYCQLKIEAGTR